MADGLSLDPLPEGPKRSGGTFSGSPRRALALVRPIVWMRWRILVGRLRSGMKRDIWSRLGRWIEPVMWLGVALFFVPAMLGALGIFGFLGYGQAVKSESWEMVRMILRLLLAGGTITILLLAVTFGGRGGGEDSSRWRLLPIDRRLLHALRWISGLIDPWFVLVGAAWTGFIVGSALGGAAWASLVAALAGTLWLATVLGIELWAVSLAVLLMRDRRRSEGILLVALLGIMGGGFVPMLLLRLQLSEAVTEALWWINLPGELAVRAIEGARDGSPWVVAACLICSALVLTLVFRGSARTFDRVLLGSADSGPRRAAESGKSRAELFLERRAAWLRRPIAAVFLTQTRLLWRSVPGKIIALQGVIWVAILELVILPTMVSAELTPWIEGHGTLIVLTLAGTMTTLNMAQQFFNQYMVEGRGLAMYCLLPLDTRDFLRGKWVGWATFALGSFALALVVEVGLGRPPILDFLRAAGLTVLGMFAAMLFLGPFAALVSAWFPKQVDLSRPFSKNQPHVLALFAGMALIAASWSVPAMGVALEILGASPRWTEAAFALWLALAAVLARILEPLVVEVWKSRREAVLLTAGGR